MSQNFVHVYIELFLRRLFHHIEKEMTVFVVDETIVEHSVHLVHPQSDKLIAFLHARGWNQENSEYDASKVTQVEHVVGLGWCGQEIVDGSFINLQCRQDYDLEMQCIWIVFMLSQKNSKIYKAARFTCFQHHCN